ncbi:MAG: hypothetical protein ACRCZF_12035 [Gemmataceae bacterium]
MAAKVAKKAHAEGTSLKDACLAMGLMDSATFDATVVAEKMTRPGLEK